MFKLAGLFVDIEARDGKLKKDVDGLKGQLSAMGVAIGAAAGNLAASAISRATAAVTGFISRGITGASDLGESISKVNAVFGDSASLITTNADQLAKAFGLPKQAILDAGANIGLVAKAAGQSQAQAAAMGAEMAKLAADASSFYNVPLDVALEKIRSGLVGEAEPLRAFGVLLNEEAVNAEAMRLGLAKSKKEIDDQAKVMARASLITQGLTDATGDLERTAGSTANQGRKFAGTMENLAVSVGTSLQPAMNAIVNLAGDMASALAAGFESSKGAFEAFASGVAEWVGTIGVAWRNLPDIWEIVQIRFREMFGNMVAALATLPENLSIVGNWLSNNWVNLIRDGVNAVMAIFANLGENIHRLGQAIANWLANPTQGFHVDFKPLLDGFQATTEKLPELARPAWISLQNEMDQVGQRIADREARRAQDLADKAAAMNAAGKKAAETAAKKQTEFTSETTGSSEFALKLRASIYEHGKDDTPKKQLDEAKKQTAKLDVIGRAVTKGLRIALS